jgi:glutathione peroxidase-family protein
MARFHQFTLRSIEGEDVDFAQFEGQVCLVVNLASR